MTTTTTFSLGAVLSLATGRLLCDFSEMQALAEFLAQRPVWTHEFANRTTVDDLKDRLGLALFEAGLHETTLADTTLTIAPPKGGVR